MTANEKEKCERLSDFHSNGNHVNGLQSEAEDTTSDAFESLLSRAGDEGRYQWKLFFTTTLAGIFVAFNSLSAAFLAATTEFRCDFSSMEIESWENVTENKIKGTEFEWTMPKCRFLSTNFSIEGPPTNITCDAWVYDTSVFDSTIITQWDLVCDNAWLRSVTQASYMAGVLIGSVILSELSDMYGRRTIVLLSSVCLSVTGVVAAFSTNLAMFLTLRFLVACFSSGVFLPNFVITMEMTGKRLRTVLGLLYQMGFSVGFILLPGIAYFIRDWKNLQLAISIPSIILFVYFKILPESPRWLFCQNRHNEALEILKEVAKTNGRTFPDDLELSNLLAKAPTIPLEPEGILKKVATFFKNQIKLVRTPIMRRRCLIIFFSWFVVSMVYYGLSFSGDNINATPHMMLFLGGVVEFPAYIIGVFTIRRYGRRLNIVSCFIICGLACLLILAVPKEMIWVNISLAMIGKLFNSVAFAIAYIYSAELVPTKVRNIAVGTSSMWARVGSAIAPFIVDSLGNIHYAIPSTVFGVLSLTAGGLDMLLPETDGMPLPDTIAQVERLKR